MYDKNKIRVMTALALYDQKYGEKDRSITGYAKWAYVALKNLKMRLLLTLAYVIAWCFYSGYLLFGTTKFVDGDFIKSTARNFIIGFVIIMVLYTVIGIKRNTNEYKKAKVRDEKYIGILEMLDSYGQQEGGEE